MRTVVVRIPRRELFRYLRSAGILAQVIRPPVAIERRSERDWVFVAQHDERGHNALEWQFRILEERPPEEIAWRCEHLGRAVAAGRVRLRDAVHTRGTVMQVRVDYEPSKGGIVAEWFHRHLGPDLKSELRESLWRLKRLVEPSAA